MCVHRDSVKSWESLPSFPEVQRLEGIVNQFYGIALAGIAEWESAKIMRMGEPHGMREKSLPDASPGIEIVLLRLIHYVRTIEAPGSETNFSFDVNIEADGTRSLTGWMMGTVSDLSLNRPAMVFMMAFDLSILAWFVCHWGKGILWPELSKLVFRVRSVRRVIRRLVHDRRNSPILAS